MKVRLEKTVFDNKIILEDQEFEIDGMTLLTGSSGVGKTTALKQLAKNYKCGYVSQDPDNQLVCDKVWHEIAFGLENMGLPSNKIRARVAEVATYLGLSDIFNKDVTELSGGQKQKVCLASVLCMAPDIVLLDEPTAMLDPISSREFWSIVERLSRDNNIIFLIVEHNDNYVSRLCKRSYELKGGYVIPKWISSRLQAIEEKPAAPVYTTVHSIRKSYGSNLILNIPTLKLTRGINCIIGPNGIGKTTLLQQLTGYSGKKLIKNSVLMPQDVKMIFTKDTVKEELDLYEAEVNYFKYKNLYNVHPLDLSGGEQHILGVYLTLLRKADLYCFDEPTKGMDRHTKELIMRLLRHYNENHYKPILIATHDLDITARFADNVIFLFNREIASEGTPREVFEGNLFYKPEEVTWE